MFIVKEVAVDEQIACEYFACDFLRCKGVCCTIPGGHGAPLEDFEIRELEEAFPFVKKYLSVQHLQYINDYGMYEGKVGDFYTRCISDLECVFVYYENDIARCSIEKAFFSGSIRWQKPISCHLFPVRRYRTPDTQLQYQRLTICTDAEIYGKKSNILLYQFVKESLIRIYGNLWYNEFCVKCRELMQSANIKILHE